MRDSAGPSLAVGFFDGVHLGHQEILRGADRALTFRNHPLSVLAPARAPRLIMSLDDRLAAIRACGVREVVALDFTPELAALSPEDFVARHLTPKGTDPRPTIRCGANWTFGAGGVGDAVRLREMGFDVSVVPYARWNGAPISSSRIRATLAEGDVAAAAAMLGHPFCVTGEVVRGKGLGAQLGFPTVNVRLPERRVALRRGVYEVVVAGVHGLANYGVAPTLGAQGWPTPVLEIHFPACEAASVPAAPFTVAFVRFIREERAFASLTDLTRQIARDCQAVRFGSPPLAEPPHAAHPRHCAEREKAATARLSIDKEEKKKTYNC